MINPGDYVRCVHGDLSKHLIVNNVYQVKSIHDSGSEWIIVHGDDKYHPMDSFVVERFAAGDKVLVSNDCISDATNLKHAYDPHDIREYRGMIDGRYIVKDIRGGYSVWPHAIPAKKIVYNVKKVSEILRWLRAYNYVYHDTCNAYMNTKLSSNFPAFTDQMFDYCGKQMNSGIIWHPDWLILVDKD